DTEAMIATQYQLFFPDRQARLKLDLSTVRLSHNGVPREGSIRFPGPEGAGVTNSICVDDSPAR
ncbi:MAG: hypothetical protein NZ561_11100, partial [Phycisphaerae bacterium]|nr:hypothetical protein [Phycisphaerae bacterium]